jgi:DNA-binding NarL/FixJ family response regulator
LARAFLEELSGQLGFVPADCAVDVCLDHYLRHRDWDAAFDTIVRSDRASALEQLMRAALDELLEAARLTTIETWYEHASQLGVDAPISSVARAEVALRYGRHMEACAFGEVAAAAEHSDLEFRALSVAGTAAHLASREEDALDLYRRAEAVASAESERRAATWGQLMCAIELEMPDAKTTLHALNAEVQRSDIKEVVRSATYGLSHQVKLGNLDLTHADAAAELVGGLSDPLLVSSFQSTYSAVLGLVGRYEEALDVATTFLATIRQYRLDFARPYALCAAALALAGMRRWSQADVDAREAIEIARGRRDAHALQLSVSQRMRVLVQQARYQEALAIEMPMVRYPLPAARAEVVCSRALVLASLGRVADARSMVDDVRDLSQAVEPAVLTSAVAAICALKVHDPDAIERVADLEQTAFTRGAVDLLVTAYRATPELLLVLLKTTQQQERLAALMRRAGDEDLAGVAGHPIFIESDPRQRLSKREREVYELLTEGLTNKEIARLLFIEESTVKVHTHHIYDKLGTRSRTALAIQAMLERADQATSATAASDAESS